MDHLKTSQERKNRWYAKNIEPIYLPIRDVELNDGTVTNSNGPCTSKQGKQENQQSNNDQYVKGIPFKQMMESKEIKEYMKLHLERYGFAVITKVLSIQECDDGLMLVWDYIEAASAAECFLNSSTVDNSNIVSNNVSSNDSNDESTHIHHVAKNNHFCDGDDDDKNHTNKRSENETNSKILESSPSLSVQRNNPSTYSNYFPRTVEGGILPFYGSGHTSFMWYLRTHPSIQNIFATIHNTTKEEMVSSLDGMIAWIQSESEHLSTTKTDGGWFHIDQNPVVKPEFESVQGLVNLLPVNKTHTGGNVLVRKSHLFFPHHYSDTLSSTSGSGSASKIEEQTPELFYKDRLKEIDGDDWLEIDPYDKEILNPNEVISCELQPGDVLIWDSRLVHCSYPAIDIAKTLDSSSGMSTSANKTGKKVMNNYMDDEIAVSLKNKHGLIRAAGLINMIPRSKVSNETRCKRIEAINCCRTLTHWVDKVAPLGEERGEESKKEKKCIDFIREWQDNILSSNKRKVLFCFEDLTEEQQKLV